MGLVKGRKIFPTESGVTTASVVNLTPMTTAQIAAIADPQLGWIRFDSTLDTAVIYTATGGWLPAMLNG